MKTIIKNLALAVLLLGFVQAVAQKPQGEDYLMKKIQAYNNQIANAMINGDDEAILSYYTSDAVSLPNYDKILIGLDKIGLHQKESDDEMKVTAIELNTMMVRDYGASLVEIGSYAITLEMIGKPQPFNDNGKYVNVWEKQDDGSYKMAVEIWNTDSNPMKYMNSEKPPKPAPEKDPAEKLIKSDHKKPKPPAEKKPSTEKKK